MKIESEKHYIYFTYMNCRKDKVINNIPVNR